MPFFYVFCVFIKSVLYLNYENFPFFYWNFKIITIIINGKFKLYVWGTSKAVLVSLIKLISLVHVIYFACHRTGNHTDYFFYYYRFLSILYWTRNSCILFIEFGNSRFRRKRNEIWMRSYSQFSAMLKFEQNFLSRQKMRWFHLWHQMLCCIVFFDLFKLSLSCIMSYL